MSPGRVFRFARKELRETLRDRRTVLTLVLMPLLLYPLLGVVFRQFFLVNLSETSPQYRIGVGTEREGDLLQRMLGFGAKPGAIKPPATKLGKQPGYADPTVVLFTATDPIQAVRDGDVHVAVKFPAALPPGSIDDLQLDLQAFLLDDSTTARDVLAYLRNRLAAANVRVLQERLAKTTMKEVPVPVTLAAQAVTSADRDGAFSLATLVPLVLILMTITGAVYPAIDLTAGERERGTLEVLMAAPVPKIGLLAAKYLAVVTVSTLTGLVNLGMMALTLWLSGMAPILFGARGLTAGTAFAVLGLLVLFAAFFSALLLALTSFARSFKEAQAYLIPLMLVALTPGLLALAPGLQLTAGKAVTPLLNVVLLARDVFGGKAGIGVAAAVVGSTLLYAAAAVALAARVFGAEAVLYGDGGQWSDLVRRPTAERPAATASGALLTLAMLFPVQFVLHGALLPLAKGNATFGLLLSSAIGVAIFVGLPLVAAKLGRIAVGRGFALAGGAWWAYPVAALLGLALAPVSAEVAELQRVVGFTSLPESVGTLLGGVDFEASLPVMLFAFALVPAVVEEFFFRGYLFTALERGSSGRAAVVSTAALFGLFHLVLGELIAVERFLPTFLVGVALGWLRLRGGSVWPGIMAHAVHNAALVMAARYGWLKESVPPTWLAAAVAGIVVCVAVGMVANRKTDSSA